MDFQIIAIVIIFVLLFFLEQFEHSNEPEPFYSYPPIPLCFSCQLNQVNSTPPYLHSSYLGDQPEELYGKVRQSCLGMKRKNYKNYASEENKNTNKPFLVAARAAGRPRVCRRLL
jgi:hypothetical protein